MSETVIAKQKQVSQENEKQNGLFDTEYLKVDLKGRSVRGGAITVFSQGCKFALHTVSTVVLARLLTPADFGLIAMVAAITNFAMMFKDLGLSTATIQKQDINHAQISTLFWINVAGGILITLAVAAIAPAVAWFYEEPRLAPVTIALASVFIFGGLTVQHQALLRRHMRFFRVGVVEILAMAASVAAAIIAGIYGAGYWSLIIMHITLAIAMAIGMWGAFLWLPGLPKRGTGVRTMLKFGGNVTGFNIINYFSRNADKILIGKFIGSTSLGFYSRAYNLLMLPITQIQKPVNMVATPAMSRLQQMPGRFRTYYDNFVSVTAFIGMPLLVLLGVCANELILLILGRKWLPAVPIFQVLAIASFIQLVGHSWGVVLLALGEARKYFKLGMLNAIIVSVSFGIGIWWGSLSVAISYAVANLLVLFPILYIAFKHTPVGIGNFLKAVFVPFIGSICLASSAYIVRIFVKGKPEIIVLGLCALVGIGCYIGAFFLVPGGTAKLRQMWIIVGAIFKKVSKVNNPLVLEQ